MHRIDHHAHVARAVLDALARDTAIPGGAITADSSQQEEYDEIRTKAYGVLSALGTGFPDS